MPSERVGEKNWFNEDKPKPRKPADAASKAERNLRKFVRFEVDDATPLVYVKGFMNLVGLGKSNKALEVMNLSEGGVLLKTLEKVPKGSKVHVRLKMEKYQDLFRADGVVRWCILNPYAPVEYFMGVEFVKVRDEQAKKLRKMRDWFTSPEYKAKTGSRARNSSGLQFPK